MAIFVINEWLWADASGSNGRDHQRRAYTVISRLGTSAHRIVIIEGSSFGRKAWNICKSTVTVVQAIARAYVVNVRQNSDRCMILKPQDAAAIPDALAAAVNPDDHYLVQALNTVSGAILVTTDEALCIALRAAGLDCITPDRLLHEYLSEGP